MTGDFIAMHRAAVTGIATVVMHRIGIEDFTPFARLIDTEAIAVARYWRKIADNDNFVAGLVTTNKNQHRTFFIVNHQPFKTIAVKVEFMQRLVMAISMVQVTHQTLHPVVPVIAAFQ